MEEIHFFGKIKTNEQFEVISKLLHPQVDNNRIIISDKSREKKCTICVTLVIIIRLLDGFKRLINFFN